MKHTCNETCRCPECGRPLMYSARRGHRCPDLDCSHSGVVAFLKKKGYW